MMSGNIYRIFTRILTILTNDLKNIYFHQNFDNFVNNPQKNKRFERGLTTARIHSVLSKIFKEV